MPETVPVRGAVTIPPTRPRARAATADTHTTPDGRYIVVRGRLWRRADPGLSEAERSRLVADLMDARRAVKAAKALAGPAAEAALSDARGRVDAAKVGLGERGPVWWTDDAPDENRRLARNTRYAQWYAGVADEAPDPTDVD